jgi:peptidoglycan/LPS O-acetylase OafA/YrhL
LVNSQFCTLRQVMNERYLFLDGLRGWAAVVVLLYHLFVNALPMGPSARWLAVLMPFNGLLAVAIFFIVSGFALSVRYLQTDDLTGVVRIAAGRYVRLAIPIFAACLLVHLCLIAGLLDLHANRLPPFRGSLEFSPTLGHLLKFSLFDVFFDYDKRESYIGPLWTMAPELYGSALTLAGIVVIRRWRAPIFASMSIAFFCLPEPVWYIGFCMIGIAAADLYLRARLPAWLAAPLLIAGLVPVLVQTFFIWWSAISTIMIFAGCVATPSARRLLESPLSIWLGWLSFPLYLVHGPVINVIGEPMMRAAGDTLAAKIGVDVLTGALSLIAATVFAKLVNDPAIQVSRRIGRYFAVSARAAP